MTNQKQSAPDAQAAIEEELIQTVVDSFATCTDDRLKELMQSLTKHLHAFIRDVRLTEDEWNGAIEFLTEAGHITDDKRQEFILLSDVFGASMQTINVNNEVHDNATEATVFGPFFVDDAPQIEIGGDISGGAQGQACWVEGTVKDTEGNPLPGARIEVWEADEEGFYDVQHSDGRVYGRAHLFSDENGKYNFWADAYAVSNSPRRAGGTSPRKCWTFADACESSAFHGVSRAPAYVGDTYFCYRR